MPITQVQIEGETVKLGQYVSFKSDTEQTGKLIKIKKNMCGHAELTLEDEDGFHGDYIGGDTTTTVLASDCWVE